MGETTTVQTEPVMAPTGRQFRLRAWPLVLFGVVALAASHGAVLFSASSEYGGVDASGGWIDAEGNPVATAPPTVSAVGHVAPAALVVLVLVLALGVVLPPTLARFGHDRAGAVIRRTAYIAAPVVVVLGVLVYWVWQGHVVIDQVEHQVMHPHGFPWGGVTVTTGHMTR